MKEKLHHLGKQYNLYPIESNQFKVAFEDTVFSPLFLSDFLDKAEQLGVDSKEWFIEENELNNNLIFGTNAIKD